MKMVWTPDAANPLSGEVKGDTIFIFDRDVHAAISTLRHEIVDYLVCKTIEPYKQGLNVLIRMLNDRVYQEKEDTVNRLSKLLDNNPRLVETS